METGQWIGSTEPDVKSGKATFYLVTGNITLELPTFIDFMRLQNAFECERETAAQAARVEMFRHMKTLVDKEGRALW